MRIRSEKGLSLVILTSAILTIAFLGYFAASNLFLGGSRLIGAYDKDSVVYDRTSHAISVLVEAMERRKWEPPLGPDCLAAPEFGFNNEISSTERYRVRGTFDAQNRLFTLVGDGELGGRKIRLEKRYRQRDIGDYFVLEASDWTQKSKYKEYQLYTITGSDDPATPTRFFAGDRIIHLDSGLILKPGATTRADIASAAANSAMPAVATREFRLIIQGQQIIANGPIRYAAGGPAEYETLPTSWGTFTARPVSLSGTGGIMNALFPSNALMWPNGLPTSGGGYDRGAWAAARKNSLAIFFTDLNRAEQLAQNIVSGTMGDFTLAELQRKAYPFALRGGQSNPPIVADFPGGAADTGEYLSDISKFKYLSYNGNFDVHGHYQVNANLTCVGQNCNDSIANPRGFARWKENAGLTDSLFGGDATRSSFGRITWDHMQTLLQDAQQCGAVVDTTFPTEEDCPFWDAGFLGAWLNSGALPVERCQRLARVNLNSIALNNFTADHYEDASLAHRLVRRVIYVKTPALLRQTQEQGLFTHLGLSAAGRARLKIWVVGENMLGLQGYQRDQSNYSFAAGVSKRLVVFNRDAREPITNIGLAPVNLTLLSSDQIHLVSPFYVAADRAKVAQYFSLASDRFVPQTREFLDASRSEDSWRYGPRDIVIENTAVVLGRSAHSGGNAFGAPGMNDFAFINPETYLEDPPVPNTGLFYLRGFWAMQPMLDARHGNNPQCHLYRSLSAGKTVDLNPATLTSLSRNKVLYDQETVGTLKNQAVLPLENAIYYATNYFPPNYVPYSHSHFASVQGANASTTTQVIFNGTAVLMDIENSSYHTSNEQFFWENAKLGLYSTLKTMPMDLSSYRYRNSSGVSVSCGRVHFPFQMGQVSVQHNSSKVPRASFGSITATPEFLREVPLASENQ